MFYMVKLTWKSGVTESFLTFAPTWEILQDRLSRAFGKDCTAIVCDPFYGFFHEKYKPLNLQA